jgi:hypothetical protein
MSSVPEFFAAAGFFTLCVGVLLVAAILFTPIFLCACYVRLGRIEYNLACLVYGYRPADREK